MKKLSAFSLLLLLAFCLLLTGCSGETQNGITAKASSNEESLMTEPEQEDDNTQIRTFTLEELKTYDGKDGNPAYVAINGVVYDVSDIPQWRNGRHHGLSAGNDVTEDFLNSPHSSRLLQRLPVVGMLE